MCQILGKEKKYWSPWDQNQNLLKLAGRSQAPMETAVCGAVRTSAPAP